MVLGLLLDQLVDLGGFEGGTLVSYFVSDELLLAYELHVGGGWL